MHDAIIFLYPLKKKMIRRVMFLGLVFFCVDVIVLFRTFNSFGGKMKGLKAVNILKIEKKIKYHCKIK